MNGEMPIVPDPGTQRRLQFYREVEAERLVQIQGWGEEFDAKNTINDWSTFISRYATYLADGSRDARDALRKIAALAAAAWDTLETHGTFELRHYDEDPSIIERLKVMGQVRGELPDDTNAIMASLLAPATEETGGDTDEL
jgi:hypothetical protein